MSARLAVASCSPAHANAWLIADCLEAVEHRCRQFIATASDANEERFNQAAHAATYHLQQGGRRIRARLALDAAHRLDLSASTAIVLASTCELLHNASLIHDDLQDRDNQRRGTAAVWTMFGDATAICSGDLMLSAAFACLAELDDRTALAPMLQLVHARTAEAIQGQTADVAHRLEPVTDIETYLRIVTGKSGALLSLPLELGLLAAGQAQSCDHAREAAHAFAIGYQIADDLDDIDKDAATDGGAAALNLVWLLRQQLGAVCVDIDIIAHCTALARRHLTVAEERAAALPQRCGTLLAELAVQMRTRL